MSILTRTIFVFVVAFVLNFLWEHAHSVLYVSYKSGVITSLILLRAALFDAAVIALFLYPFLQVEKFKTKRWLLYTILVIFAVLLETWALSTGRWAYTSAMPLIPILNVGLTPTIQLALLGFISVRASDSVFPRRLGGRGSIQGTI